MNGELEEKLVKLLDDNALLRRFLWAWVMTRRTSMFESRFRYAARRLLKEIDSEPTNSEANIDNEITGTGGAFSANQMHKQ